MGKKKSFLGQLFSFGNTSTTRGFADAMKILRSTKPTKLTKSKPRSGIFK